MKKKGLVVSTIVMVVVLIAALSTATYAWFSTTASATVQDLNIQTNAAEGLQIAMVNTPGNLDNMSSGQLTYDMNGWHGESDTWGSYLGFQQIQIGNMKDAVTKVPSGTTLAAMNTQYKAPIDGYKVVANAAIASPVEGTMYYVAEMKSIDATTYRYGRHYAVEGSNPIAADSILKKITAAPASETNAYEIKLVTDVSQAPAANNWYCTANTADWATVLTGKTTGTDPNKALSEDIWLVPTGYDNNVQPIAFELATPNSHYYYLTMAVTNTVEIEKLGMSVKLTPNGTIGTEGVEGGKYPGMVAASRLDIGVQKLDPDNTLTKPTRTEKPFDKWVLQQNNTFGKSSVADANEDGKYAYQLANSAQPVGSVYFVTMFIYIEGTDAECSNQTTGSGFDLSIAFIFAKQGLDLNFKTDDLLGTTWNGTISTALMPVANTVT